MLTQKFSLLGSTGSIGTQTLDIISEFPDKFELVALAAGSNVKLLAEQVNRSRQQSCMQAHLTTSVACSADLSPKRCSTACNQGAKH